MTLTEFGGLLVVYLVCVVIVLTLAYREFRRVGFSFNILFSLLFLLTFYFGFPLTCLLVFQFAMNTVTTDNLLYSLLASTSFYTIYYVCYKTRLLDGKTAQKKPLLSMNRVETQFVSWLLGTIALATVGVFFLQNGFLLFRLQTYSQIFSGAVFGVALKRFFYFFIPSMLIVYFSKPTKANWLLFFCTTVGFGILTYLLVGGTRANMLIAISLFFFIGIIRGYINLWMLIVAGIAGIVGMFWLALKRYGLEVNGSEAFYTFLYLTRDTFSPWENVGLLLQNYHKIEFQGLAPIIRDFYVFIPSVIWPERPDLILNTANYFTWDVLNYYAGLAISPTLIGSLLIMGGISAVPIGAIVVGLIIKWFDELYWRGRLEKNRYRSAILQAFCFGAIFNLIVLVREGIDSFVSRIVFFALIFGLSIILAKLVYWLLHSAGVVREK